MGEAWERGYCKCNVIYTETVTATLVLYPGLGGRGLGAGPGFETNIAPDSPRLVAEESLSLETG